MPRNTNNRLALALGYVHGARHGNCSWREADRALRSFPLLDRDTFCNGADDGKRGDTWRLLLHRGAIAKAEQC